MGHYYLLNLQHFVLLRFAIMNFSTSWLEMSLHIRAILSRNSDKAHIIVRTLTQARHPGRSPFLVLKFNKLVGNSDTVWIHYDFKVLKCSLKLLWCWCWPSIPIAMLLHFHHSWWVMKYCRIHDFENVSFDFWEVLMSFRRIWEENIVVGSIKKIIIILYEIN